MEIRDFPFSHTGSHEPTDPVNVVVRRISFNELFDFLKRRGWSETSLSLRRYLPLPGTLSEMPVSHELVFEHTPYGLFDRIHFRLWKVDLDTDKLGAEVLIGNVHRDATKFGKGHVAVNFEAAKSFLASECAENPGWETKNNEVDLRNRLCTFEEPFHCGFALLVEKKVARL